jgi:hypothetical protein
MAIRFILTMRKVANTSHLRNHLQNKNVVALAKPFKQIFFILKMQPRIAVMDHRDCIKFIRSEKKYEYCKDVETLWFLWKRWHKQEMSKTTFEHLYEYEATGKDPEDYNLSIVQSWNLWLYGDTEVTYASACDCNCSRC